jgi:hypothetical protein
LLSGRPARWRLRGWFGPIREKGSGCRISRKEDIKICKKKIKNVNYRWTEV